MVAIYHPPGRCAQNRVDKKITSVRIFLRLWHGRPAREHAQDARATLIVLPFGRCHPRSTLVSFGIQRAMQGIKHKQNILAGAA